RRPPSRDRGDRRRAPFVPRRALASLRGEEPRQGRPGDRARMKAFVTGGTGFLGVNVVAELAKRGWEIAALHRKTSDLTYLRRFGVTLVEGRLDDAESAARALPEDTDVVFHVGADLSTWSK